MGTSAERRGGNLNQEEEKGGGEPEEDPGGEREVEGDGGGSTHLQQRPFPWIEDEQIFVARRRAPTHSHIPPRVDLNRTFCPFLVYFPQSNWTNLS